MALVCDVCKIRPASARVAFMHNGQQQVIDVCSQDFHKLQSGNPNEITGLLDGLSSTVQPFTKTLLRQAALVAADFGQHEIGAEHLLIALIDDQSSQPLFEALSVNPDDIRGYISVNALRDIRHTDKVPPSQEVKNILHDAAKTAQENSTEADASHVLAALLADDGMTGTLLRNIGVTSEALEKISDEIDSEELEEDRRSLRTVKKYSRDLTALAKEGKLDPVIGREQEIETTIEILSRRTKNNPVLIGEPGVGKTAIIEGLAQQIVAAKVPKSLQGKTLLELNLNSMVAGSRYRGEFEERMQAVLKEITANKDDLLIFIDELHVVVGAGATEGSLDAANVIKPALARGDLHLIGATTLNEYQKYIEKDAALERRFQPVMVKEPSLADSILIIQGVRPKYEQHHQVKISDAAVRSAVELSDRYMTQRFLPDKAIDLIDQAASRVRIKAGEKADLVVTDANIAEILAKLTGIPVTEVTQVEKEKLLGLENRLHERVIGQNHAVEAVANSIRVSRAGLTDRHSPIATFLFLGPTGVGKTELAKALAADLFGNENALIRIDMSEYMERHAVSRLVGSPPGYVGYDEGGQLTEQVRRRPYSVILLDEIEKAHPDVANILLQLFDDGRLTDGKGRVVDFSNTVIIATSNLGNDQNRPARIGFQENSEESVRMDQDIIEQLRQHFRPEFVNRIDEIISFHALNEEQIGQIVDLQLAKVAGKVTAQGLTLTWSPAVVEYFARIGFDIRFGARELQRKIKTELENKLAQRLLQDKPKKTIKLDCKNGALTFK